jgi:hypothetical protein
VERPDLRDRIVEFVREHSDRARGFIVDGESTRNRGDSSHPECGGLAPNVGDWGTGKMVAACEVGHWLRPDWLSFTYGYAMYHASVNEVPYDPGRIETAGKALRRWLRRWPVRGGIILFLFSW